ncbi:DUF3011 domain-containing protein [Dokdonella sp. MW10]|uniref:DUF3011 domain-containing protein n=1 Tax=Dokdonella sp. MW10 TaxID=2992926 RepID=UPI003F8237CB
MKTWAALGLVVAGAFAAMPQQAEAQPPRGGYGPDRVECNSRDYRLTRCDVSWREADLARQTSSARCVRGQTWGIDRRGLWVDRGCAGVFVEAGRGGGRPGPGGPGGWAPGPDWDREIRLSCSSSDFRYRFCQVDIGPAGRVRIERQLSDTACIEGRTWGYNRAGVWVDRGCAAFFSVGRRWR